RGAGAGRVDGRPAVRRHRRGGRPDRRRRARAAHRRKLTLPPPVRPRASADLPACVAALRRVPEASGYPSRWPDDPRRRSTPRRMVAAWVAELDGSIAGHVVLVRGMRLDCLLWATGLPAEALGGIARLYVDPAFQRRGLARALLEVAADGAVAHGLRP